MASFGGKGKDKLLETLNNADLLILDDLELTPTKIGYSSLYTR